MCAGIQTGKRAALLRSIKGANSMMERKDSMFPVRNPYQNSKAGYYPPADDYTFTSRQRLVIFLSWGFALIYMGVHLAIKYL
jgi:hypothetical protein